MSDVRILAPTGELGTIPEEQLEAARAEGAILMTPERMREMRQNIFMEHQVFKQEHKRPDRSRRRRRSIVRGSRSR